MQTKNDEKKMEIKLRPASVPYVLYCAKATLFLFAHIPFTSKVIPKNTFFCHHLTRFSS